MKFNLRQAQGADLDFLLTLRKQTMDPHLQKVAGAVDEQAHLSRIRYRFDAAKIVLVQGRNAGLLKCYCDESTWVIVQVQLAPEYQGKGLGEKIIGSVLQQAIEEGKDVTLSVLKGNPAKALYTRLGFTVIATSDIEYTMRFR